MKHYVLIFKEKHGDRHFHLRGDTLREDRVKVFQKVFKERDTDEHWYFPEAMSSSERRFYCLAKEGDQKALLTFMESRIDYEYESWELVELQEVE